LKAPKSQPASRAGSVVLDVLGLLATKLAFWLLSLSASESFQCQNRNPENRRGRLRTPSGIAQNDSCEIDGCPRSLDDHHRKSDSLLFGILARSRIEQCPVCNKGLSEPLKTAIAAYRRFFSATTDAKAKIQFRVRAE
jgi:hypothetical protein